MRCRGLVALAVAGAAVGVAFSSPGLAAQQAPTRASAEAFVASAESRLARDHALSTRASWIRATNITVDTDALVEQLDAEQSALVVQLGREAAAWDEVAVDPVVRRKLDLLKRLLDMPPPQRAGGAEELAEVSGRLSTTYATGAFEFEGRRYTLGEAERALAASRDPARSQALWEGWRTVARPMRADYVRMVALGNEGARDLGFADVGAMWRSGYDMEPDAFADEVDRLWAQLRPLYVDLHCYVRARLNTQYGDAVQSAHGLIRADLTGNMWGQNWSGILDITAPQGSTPFDLTPPMKARFTNGEALTRAADGFYGSLGLAPLASTFWTLSQFERPAGRQVDCNASAWTIDEKDDVRIKACFAITGSEWRTSHHELGHNYYQRAYQAQPYLFREGANGGFHEGLGGLRRPVGGDPDLSAGRRPSGAWR
jgi:peptidyl-dipeptidase A